MEYEKDKEILHWQTRVLSRDWFPCLEDYILEAIANRMEPEKLFLYAGDKNHDVFKSIRESKLEEKRQQDFTYFWETKSPFSQWYKSSFFGPSFLNSLGFKKDDDIPEVVLRDYFPKEGQEYSSAEQFMMYQKAMIFLDRKTAKKIMATDNPRKIKQLGREVENFDNDVWKYYRCQVVYQANQLKFSQNMDIQLELLDTMGSTLVEAAPNDKIWGIGLSADNPKAKQRETWEGKNLLGEILTLIRIQTLGFY